MDFQGFRPVTKGRRRRANIVFWGLVLAFLALYGVTTVRYAFPGDSAAWIAWVAGLDVRAVPSRPLLSLLGGVVSRIPVLPLALRLNLLSAVAGAFAVGWVFRLVWFFVFDAMREDSAVRFASRVALWGGVTAALAVGLSLPFWQAATRFQPEVFELALLMGCFSLVVAYACTCRFAYLLVFGVLYGLGLAESPVFIVAAPVAFAAVLVTEWRLGWFNPTGFLSAGMLALVMYAAATFVNARMFLVRMDEVASMEALWQVAVSVWREQLGWLLGLVGGRLWLVAFMFGAGTAVLSLYLATRALNNERSWSTYMLSICLTLAAFAMLFNVPFTPWAVDAPHGRIPAATYLLSGLGLGVLVAVWRAIALMDAPGGAGSEESGAYDKFDRERIRRLVSTEKATGMVVYLVLTGVIVFAGFVNTWHLVSDDGAFADRAADELLDALDGRRWVVSNGLLDAHLLIRAHERSKLAPQVKAGGEERGGARQNLHLICLYRARQGIYRRTILKAVMNDDAFTEKMKLRLESLMRSSFHLFVDSLFAMDAEIADKAVCLGMPDLWYSAKWVPVPELLFYGGVRDVGNLDGDAMITAHNAFWQRWERFLGQGTGSPRKLSHRHRVALRSHLAFVANNLGVTLIDLDKQEQAFDVFAAARKANPDNISALLNTFDLIEKGIRPELRRQVERDLREKVVRHKTRRYPLWALSRHSGYVRNADFFVAMGWQWALSSNPNAVLAGLRSAVARKPQGQGKPVATLAMLASLYEMQGDRKKSQVTYRQALDADPQNVFAVSGLARLALRDGQIDEAQSILKSGEEAGAPKRSLRLDWAALQLASGNLPHARVALQEMCDEPDAPPSVLAMLAMVMLEQGEADQVEVAILPKLHKNAKDREVYFAHVIGGRVWQSKGKPGYEKARACYLRAFQLRPDMTGLLDAILALDMAMDDMKNAEVHALVLLRHQPEHATANLVVGTLRLQNGLYGDAEEYLKRSATAERPTLAALNNYAELLCRIRKLEEAFEIAKQAVKQAPERYEGWSTLAFILARQEKTGAASQALEKARALNTADKRLDLIDAFITMRNGDAATAEKLLTRHQWETAGLATTDLHMLDEIRKELATLQADKQ